MGVPPLPRTPGGSGRFFEAYTQGFTTVELERLFTRDTPDAYRFFSRNIDFEHLKKLPWHRRTLAHLRLLFLAFTMKLTPARRAIYGASLLFVIFGLLELFQGWRLLILPHPVFAPGAMWLVAGFLLINLLVLLEVADRLSLKNDLEIAREIQQAMLPRGAFHAPGIEAFGMTRPANTVGGDFYDILPLPDGRVLLALGDVAGKGSPAALLMALLLAMMRTLVDEGLEGAALAERLNVQIARHAPRSRFVTLFVSVLNPTTGELVYVNAGQNPPLLRRCNGSYERLRSGGMALGMFDGSCYEQEVIQLRPGDLLFCYTDGVTEALNVEGEEFGEARLQALLCEFARLPAEEVRAAVVERVLAWCRGTPQHDDLTFVVLKVR